METPNTNKELIESTTHLIIDSSNKEYKIKQWKKDRLIKAIDIFKQQEGVYFSLLEKIYKDDKNFATYQSKNITQQDKQVKTRFHNINQTFSKYSPDELEKILQESQKDKFK